MTMEIKAAQFSKNDKLTEVSQDKPTNSAKINSEGKSFIEEMASLPKDTTEKLTDVSDNVKLTEPEDSIAFEFVSTSDFNGLLQQGNGVVLDNQAKHKAAEKELVNEIVLMNNKQNADAKNNIKGEFDIAQSSVANKSDDLLLAEKQENNLVGEMKDFEVIDINKIEPGVLSVVDEAPNLSKIESDVLFVVDEAPNLSKIEPEVLSVADGFENELLLPIKDNAEEIVGTPEVLKPIAESKFEINENVSVEPTDVAEIQKEVIETPDFVDMVQPKNLEEVQALAATGISERKETELKSENKTKNVFNKPAVEKPEMKTEIVGQVKDIADNPEIKAVDAKPVNVQDIKVIKMEIPNPLVDMNKSLNTAKTTDIVNFIDANLSTNSTNKSKSAKSTDVSKKSEEKSIKMTEADAKFFNNLVEANQQSVEVKTAEQSNLLKDVETAQAAKVSKTLLNALKESQETNKSFRVDFDKDISVVLRVSKNGQISADFIPGDEAVEQYLRTNIPLLKQKFSDEGLEYDNLSYRQSKKENNEDKQRNNGRENKKENGYE